MTIFSALIELIISFVSLMIGEHEMAIYALLLSILLVLFDIDTKQKER